MQLTRRSFFIGLGATAAVAAIPNVLKLTAGEISVAKFNPSFRFRRICDIHFGLTSPSPSDVGVQWKFCRNTDVCFLVGINSRASYRWCAIDALSEIIIRETDLLQVIVDPVPAGNVVNLSMTSNMEKNIHLEAKKFCETFVWSNGRLEDQTIAALDPTHEYLIS